MQKEFSSNHLKLKIIKRKIFQAAKFVESLNKDFHSNSVIVLQDYSITCT
jgi:hypothetical protein